MQLIQEYNFKKKNQKMENEGDLRKLTAKNLGVALKSKRDILQVAFRFHGRMLSILVLSYSESC
jgi:hypothetical protein